MARRKPPAEVELQIQDLDAEGRGVGLVGERTVRVKNALPGETVRARVLKRRRGEWLSEAFAVGDAAAERRAAPCELFPRCGGCQLQHMPPAYQLATKQQQLLEALEDAGVDPAVVATPVHGPQFGYRTKARLGVRVVGESVLVGFRETASNRVARMDACLNLTTELSTLIAPLKALLLQLDGAARIPQIEVAQGGGHCALIVRHLDPLTDHDLQHLHRFAVAMRVSLFTQAGGPDTIERLAGQALLRYDNPDFGLTFRFHPTEFTQVNEFINRALVRHAVAALNVTAGTRVLDLFCGNGNFSLPLARRGASVTGVEGSAAAVSRARENAALNGLGRRCEFHVGDLYDAGQASLGEDATAVLADPPRSGLGTEIESWLAPSVQRMVYVSCNPATFATDAARLRALGFRLSRVGVYDMFPNTAHIETLGVFTRTDAVG